MAGPDLDQRITRLLIGRPMAYGERLMGVEYERLLLDAETGESAPLETCQRLLADAAAHFGGSQVVEDGVLKGVAADGFDLSIEPGGQVEIAVPPRSRLDAIDRSIAAVDVGLTALLRGSGHELVALGHAPVTPVEALGLLARHRYRIMDERMPRRGALTRNMMRATAGFQLTYDVADIDDAARKLALLNRLVPVLMALSANSRRVAGADSGFASYRHRVWLDTDVARTGVPAGCLHAETAIAGYVEFAKRAPMLFAHGAGGLEAVPELSLAEADALRPVGDEDLELHLSSLFPFVRLRNYVELRCFDSVEWPLARSILALVSGLVYCRRAFAAAEQLSAALAVDDGVALRELHFEAARSGLDAVAGGRALRELAAELIDVAGATLGKRDCDWAAPADLEAVADLVAVDRGCGQRPARR